MWLERLANDDPRGIGIIGPDGDLTHQDVYPEAKQALPDKKCAVTPRIFNDVLSYLRGPDPESVAYRIWLRNSLVRGSLASSKKVTGAPCSTMTPRSVK